jgi:protein O-mannosyl-transferase
MRKIISTLSAFDKKVIGLICLLTVIVFGKGIQGEFLTTWDDNQQIVENPDVTNLNLNSIKNYFTTYYVASYQPLASLSFGIEYAIFGENAKVHHITNLILHLINIVLVYLLILALFKDKYVPLIVATFFAIHPFQTEVLGWISTRSTLMYAGFVLLASNIFVRRIKQADGKIELKTLLVVLFLYILATLTKSASIVFPFTLMLLYVFVMRKWNRKLLLNMIPFFAVSVAAGLASISSRESGGETFNAFYSFYSVGEHILIRLKTLYFYLIEPFYQAKLHIYRAFITSPDKVTGQLLPDYFLWQSIVAVVVLGTLIFLAFRNRKNTIGAMLFFGLIWFFINIGLNFNFFAVSMNMLAERYLYLPSIGSALLLIALIQAVHRSLPKIKVSRLYIVVLTPLFIFYSITSFRQIDTWKNVISLYKQDMKYATYHYSYLQLGLIYHKKNRHQKALQIYNDYIKMNPNEVKIYLHRALLINDMGDVDYAEKDVYRILNLRHIPEAKEQEEGLYARAFYHLGMIWQNRNRSKSLNYLDSAIQLGSPDALLLRQQMKLVGGNPGGTQTSQSNGYDFKANLSKEDKAEEGSVYEIVPKCLSEGKYDKALYYLELMDFVAADSAITYIYRAQALIALNQKSEALGVLEEGLDVKGIRNEQLENMRLSLKTE